MLVFKKNFLRFPSACYYCFCITFTGTIIQFYGLGSRPFNFNYPGNYKPACAFPLQSSNNCICISNSVNIFTCCRTRNQTFIVPYVFGQKTCCPFSLMVKCTFNGLSIRQSEFPPVKLNRDNKVLITVIPFVFQYFSSFNLNIIDEIINKGDCSF